MVFFGEGLAEETVEVWHVGQDLLLGKQVGFAGHLG